MSYSDIWSWYWSDAEDTARWKYKRRNTVLGKWHQVKKEMWQEHSEACAQEKLANELEEAPF